MFIETLFEIFETPSDLAEGFADEFRKTCEEIILVNGKINIALSGGNTPKMLFTVLAAEYKNIIDWTKINFYWVDERCVSPDDEQSNFGMANRTLLMNIPVPKENINMIIGENDPQQEAIRYGELIIKNVPPKNSIPQFHLMLLGVGDDGHTASIFPDQMKLLNCDKYSAVATHPETNQKRITLTGKLINNSERINFLATGIDKSKVIGNILNKKGEYLKYPAAYIQPSNGVLKWYLDKEAGKDVVNS